MHPCTIILKAGNIQMKESFKVTVANSIEKNRPIIKFIDLYKYEKFISSLKIGTTLLVTITDLRTVDQNALLHKVISEISSYTGESLDDLKAFFKHKFLGYVNHEVTDYMCDEDDDETDCTKYAIKKTVQELRSTTTLTKKEFSDFITQIQSWAWENLSLNLSNIPDD